MSSAHLPLLHNSLFQHFFLQWSAHFYVSVCCEHFFTKVAVCSAYIEAHMQAKHIIQSHVFSRMFILAQCHWPPKSVASYMISPMSWILGVGYIISSLHLQFDMLIFYNYPNFDLGSSMGKLYFNRLSSPHPPLSVLYCPPSCYDTLLLRFHIHSPASTLL